MKVTVVPAQVTTVEDRIMGSLTFSQVLLLVVPLFISAALFAVLPPFMSGSLYKYILMGTLALTCCILAIRIRGKILAIWLITILRFNLRPNFYVFNKNTDDMRERYDLTYELTDNQASEVTTRQQPVVSKLAFGDSLHALTRLENPASKVRFETTKKGGLHVRFTEIQD